MKKLLIFCLAIAFAFSTKISCAQTQITFYTSMGTFEAEMYDTLQPITAGNFIDLVNAEFYDSIIFHRVINNFMIQGGDPTGTGYGGPGYTIPDEFDPLASNVQKALGMANSGPNTGGSQFFINLVDNLYLDPNYPVFGIVISNFSVVQAIGEVETDNNDRPLIDVVMDSLRVTQANPVGLNEENIQSSNFNVYPNPTNNRINIDCGNEFSIENEYKLKITNILSQTIYTTPIKHQKTKLDLLNYSNTGIYFVHLMDAQSNTLEIRKILLQ